MISVHIIHPCPLYPWTTHLSPWGLLQVFKTPIPFEIKPANVVGFFFLFSEIVSSSLFVVHKKFESDWHVVSSLTWRRGSRDIQAGCGAQPLPLQEKWALGSVWERVGDSSLGRASGVHSFQGLCSFHALMGRGALSFGVEGIKKTWLCTNLPFMSALTKLHFIKRQSHFPDTSCACSDLPPRTPVIPKVWFSSLRK